MKNKSKYNRLSNIKYVITNLWHWDKPVLFFALMQALTGLLLSAMGVYLPKLVIDEVTIFSGTLRLVLVICGFTLLMAAISFFDRFSTAYVNSSAMANRIKYFFMRNMKAMDCDYSRIESAEGQAMYQKLNRAILNDSGGPQAIVRILPRLLMDVAGFFLFGGIISMLNPLVILLLLITSLLNYFVLQHISKFAETLRTQDSAISKKMVYVAERVADFHTAKDIRLYNIGTWFIKVFEDLIVKDKTITEKLLKKEYLSNITAALILLFRDSLAYSVLIWYVMDGNITVSDFVLYFGAISSFSGFVNSVVGSMYSISRASLDMKAIREYLDMPDTSNRSQGLPLPDMNGFPLSVEFRDVCFKYSDKGEYVLKNFNLKIWAGEKLALVGANGVGKTTLVKLLCGFYQPLSGEILINGIPLLDFNRDRAYELFSVVFQDIFIVPFSVAKNVALTEEEYIDRDRVKECLEAAGLSHRLPDMDAALLKVMKPDGIELSGGEAQKLILARALYKAAPVLILDEPTAALDPIAESELYHHYSRFSQGKTSIYISHRLASTSFCDRIAFIENGYVKELGSHNELIELGGGYKRMFNIQSHYYKENLTEVTVNE